MEPQKQEPRSSKRQVRDDGFSMLHDPEAAFVDIVFVHGLQGHPMKTWTYKKTSKAISQNSRETEGDIHQRGIKKLFSRIYKAVPKDESRIEEETVFWPLDLLPRDCANSRILTWGYDSKVSRFFSGAANQSSIADYARNLLHGLRSERINCQGRPLIFVAHSLGGIIVKDVLTRAAGDVDQEIQDIYKSVEALFFLGTPHGGSDQATLGEVVRRIVSVSGFDTTDRNIRALQVDSSELERIQESFLKICTHQDFQVFTFQEAKGVMGISYLGLNKKVVSKFSSTLGVTGETILTIAANHMSMCRFTSSDDQGYKQILGGIRIVTAKIQKRLEEAEFASLKTGHASRTTAGSTAYSLNDEERKCIALLTQNATIAAKHKSSLPSRVEGTCQWILSNTQFLSWKMQEKSCLLWISGYPGSGKTILSAYLMDYLGAEDISPDSRTTMCYFFCVDRISTQRDGPAILRSLIHQLVLRHRSLIKYVKASNDVHVGQFDQDFNELWKTFIKMACDKRLGRVSVIVDAIDECEAATRDEFLKGISNLIRKPQSAGSKRPCIKFLVTSRPPTDRLEQTTIPLHIDPSQNHVEQDLKLVIQTKVNGIARRTQCGPKVKAYLENALCSKADRTFLWVHLVLHLLEDSYLASQEDFKRIIDELPTTLTATYERFLESIPISKQKHATKLLRIIIGSPRPVTLEEMQIMFAIEDHHRSLSAVAKVSQPNIQMTIERALGPLVRISESRIYLVHQSLKEFLLNLSTQTDNPLSAIYGVNTLKAKLEIVKACVSYLSLRDFQQDLFEEQLRTKDSPTSPVSARAGNDIEGVWDPFDLGEDEMFWDPALVEEAACQSIAERYPLFDYSARHWARLFSSACSISPLDLQESVLLQSDISKSQGLNWFRFYWQYAENTLPCPRDFGHFLIASYFGHSTSLKLLLRRLPIEPGIGAHSLYWASRMGHDDVVDLLLREEVGVDMVIDGGSALIVAIQFNRLDVIKQLLKPESFISEEKGYLVNYPSAGRRTPLSIAAGNGFVEAVKQLLRHSQILPDIADSNLWTPLFWSICGQSLDVVQLLLTDNRVSVNHVDRSGRNFFSWAASEGELEIVRYVVTLEHLRVDQPDLNGRTPLSWAAGNGHLDMTIYLRRNPRFDVSRKDKDGRNALSWACEGGHYQVVEYLIKHDPEGADEEDVDGWTPLAWALFKEAPKTVQVLLDSGLVDVNKKDKNGLSALSFAVGYGYLSVVCILLKTKGIEIDSKDNDGRTPLSKAADKPEILKELQKLIE